MRPYKLLWPDLPKSNIMTNFEIMVNNQKLCVAGIDKEGILSITVMGRGPSQKYVVPDEKRAQINVNARSDGVHVRWLDGPVYLRHGDTITIRIIDDGVVDIPTPY